jgi:hypothetical protein
MSFFLFLGVANIDSLNVSDVWSDFIPAAPPTHDVWSEFRHNEVSAFGCSDKYWSCKFYGSFCWLGWLSNICPETCGLCRSVFTRLDDSQPYLSAEVKTMVENYHPIFDFTSDSCLPDAAVDRNGRVNNGAITTTLTTGCRSKVFMNEANTYHRWTSVTIWGRSYHAHMFELYFEKDRTKLRHVGGHVHEVETVILYFTDGRPTHVAVSAHGSYTQTLPWEAVILGQGMHPMIVYHSDKLFGLPLNTHAFRFAKPHEPVHNPEGKYVFPVIASWYCFQGYNTFGMQAIINSITSFALKIADIRFYDNINNRYKPAGYPTFA